MNFKRGLLKSISLKFLFVTLKSIENSVGSVQWIQLLAEICYAYGTGFVALILLSAAEIIDTVVSIERPSTEMYQVVSTNISILPLHPKNKTIIWFAQINQISATFAHGFFYKQEEPTVST